MLYLKENWSANDHSSLAESDSDNFIWSNSKCLLQSLTSTDFFFNKIVVLSKEIFSNKI